MWKNFIRVAIRNLNKNRAFNAINISGLTIGLTSAIFIILYIVSELGYDRMYDRPEDIYRLYISGKMAGEEFIQKPYRSADLLARVDQVLGGDSERP